VYSVKDKAFEEEHEWRLICYPNMNWADGEYVYLNYEGVKSRVRNGQVVPYIVVEPVGDLLLPIASITCGPNPHPSLTERAVKLALKSKGYTCPVLRSKVPLRTFG